MGGGGLSNTCQKKTIWCSIGRVGNHPCVVAACRPPIPPLGCMYSFFLLGTNPRSQRGAPAVRTAFLSFFLPGWVNDYVRAPGGPPKPGPSPRERSVTDKKIVSRKPPTRLSHARIKVDQTASLYVAPSDRDMVRGSHSPACARSSPHPKHSLSVAAAAVAAAAVSAATAAAMGSLAYEATTPRPWPRNRGQSTAPPPQVSSAKMLMLSLVVPCEAMTTPRRLTA